MQKSTTYSLIPGYEGVFCHINTDECASQPCLNNGKCIDKINLFHCECPKGKIIYKNMFTLSKEFVRSCKMNLNSFEPFEEENSTKEGINQSVNEYGTHGSWTEC